jgi:hypothetical protein
MSIQSGFVVWFAYPARRYQMRHQSAQTVISDRPHFDQSNCLEKSIGEPPLISLVELAVVPHKVEVDRDA